jgi:hypothetical protein
MLNAYLLSGFVLLTIGVVLRRYYGERAMSLLSPAEKLAILDSFSALRAFGAIPLFLLLFAFIGVGYLSERLVWPAYWLSWLLMAAYFVIVHFYIYSRMRRLGINSTYVSANRRARLFSYAGLLAFFVLSTAGIYLAR